MFLTHSSFIWCYYICQSLTGRCRENWESFCLPDHSEPHQGGKYKEWGRVSKKEYISCDWLKNVQLLSLHYFPSTIPPNKMHPCGTGSHSKVSCLWRRVHLEMQDYERTLPEKKHSQSQSAVLRTNGWQRGDADILNLWYEVYQDFLPLMPYLQCNSWQCQHLFIGKYLAGQRVWIDLYTCKS